MNDRIKRDAQAFVENPKECADVGGFDGDDIEPTALVYTKAVSSFIFEWDSVRCWFSALSSATAVSSLSSSLWDHLGVVFVFVSMFNHTQNNRHLLPKRRCFIHSSGLFVF